ncbi:MAG TPA: prealbumin-like fold domain-containing protein, partial [Streptosporangiaceae bacterium]|nr:prealbumin-like fold domain-containing protein [Streptosporangiaceae bacterium]
CLGPLSGSTFEGGDGNLLVNTPGNTDWANVKGLNPGFDLPSGTGDNSFGQGTKEDNPAVTVVSGSIPPNKSDLTRFYEASEFASNSNFLYLAWERTNVLGSANMDFEINQVTTPGLGTPGAHTINRTAGDLLVTFDFTNGGGTPTLGLLRWVTSGPTSQCFSSNSLPCWGNHVILNGTDSIGAVNNLDAVSDPIAPGAPRSLPPLTFGETAINLTAAGVFPPGTCAAFGSAFLKSRASAAFGSEVKDFVAPVPVNISNCGQVTIIKHTDPRGLNQDFSYTSTLPDPAAGSTTPACTADTTPSGFTLNDNGNTNGDNSANTEDCANVVAGSYTVTEGAEPANFTLESLTCTATPGSSGAQDGANPFQANISVIPGGHVTCTYTNHGAGAILITKTAKNHNLGAGQHPLAGATFTVNGVSKTTGADGQACFDGLTIGTAYTVTETSAPPGYSIDTTSQTVTPTSPASCTSGTPASVSFTDSPLTDISVNASSEAAGATNSTITCVDSGNTNIGNSPQGPADPVNVSANGLKPGIYTCTINIDP